MEKNKNEHTYVSPVWTEERKKWLIDNTKGKKRQEAYDLFCKAFPEVKTTIVAVTNQRSRLRCAEYTCKHGSTKTKPLWSEDVKQGYVRIKIALPSTWMQKGKWVWLETHPEELSDLLETDAFYFADGNNRNFNPDNIIRVHRREQTIFIAEGGVVKDNPEETKLNLYRARLKIAQLDAGEKAGLVVKHGDSRMFREELNRKVREYQRKKRKDPEYKKRLNENAKKYVRNRTEEQKAHYREYQREWARKKRQETKE